MQHWVFSLGLGVLGLFAGPALACDRPVCSGDASLSFSHIVTFDDQPSGMGPGRQVLGVLELDGASFGESFAGQSVIHRDDFDSVTGPATGPLQLLAGAEGQNLSILRLIGTNVLSGDGPRGFPNTSATGEGSVAILFADAHSAIRLILRGGEGGDMTVLFLARNGEIIDRHDVGPLGEGTFHFVRSTGSADIAGIVLSNHDPEGIAIDEVAFGLPAQSS